MKWLFERTNEERPARGCAKEKIPRPDKRGKGKTQQNGHQDKVKRKTKKNEIKKIISQIKLIAFRFSLGAACSYWHSFLQTQSISRPISRNYVAVAQ